MELKTIQSRIYEIRGIKVMLDFDLATLYQVETRVFNQAVRRNLDLFPEDFMIHLTAREWETMSSQFVMTYPAKRPKSAPPLAFTEHGVAMLASVLKSQKARLTSVDIIRVFIRLKKVAGLYEGLEKRIKELESRYDKKFMDVHEAINFLLKRDVNRRTQAPRKQIGFKK